MNSTIVDICLNAITMSTEEYTIGHFSPTGIQQRHRTVPCLYGAHLHFEVNEANDRNKIINPYPYLP